MTARGFAARCPRLGFGFGSALFAFQPNLGCRQRFAVSAIALSLNAAAPALPPPAADPLSPNLRDPFLDFANSAVPDSAFRSAVTAAIAREPEVLQALAQIDEADAQRREARGALRPRIDIDVNAQRVISRAFDNDPDNVLERSRPRERADAALSAEQLITDFGASRNRLSAARFRTSAASARVEAITEDVTLRAASAWFAVYTTNADLALAQALIARNRVILGQVRDRATSGVGSRGDIPRVEISVAQAEVVLSRARQALDTAISRYERIFGAKPLLPLARPQTNIGVLTEDAALALVDKRPDVTFAQQSLEAARRDFKAARSDRAPRVTAGIDAAKYDLADNAIDHDVRGRLTLRQSLYRGGASEARVDATAARLAQSEFALARAREDAERDTRIAWTDLASRDRELIRLNEAYIAARQTRDVYVEQFRVTRGNLIELLRAETDFQQAASALIRGAGERDLARLQLLTETGTILNYFGSEAK